MRGHGLSRRLRIGQLDFSTAGEYRRGRAGSGPDPRRVRRRGRAVQLPDLAPAGRRTSPVIDADIGGRGGHHPPWACHWSSALGVATDSAAPTSSGHGDPRPQGPTGWRGSVRRWRQRTEFADHHGGARAAPCVLVYVRDTGVLPLTSGGHPSPGAPWLAPPATAVAMQQLGGSRDEVGRSRAKRPVAGQSRSAGVHVKGVHNVQELRSKPQSRSGGCARAVVGNWRFG
jgi:hypothetical protein